MQSQTMSLLFVTDDADDVAVVRRTLAETPGADFDLTHADGLRGKQPDLWNERKFDVVLLDLQLQDDRQSDVLLRLRAQTSQPSIVVVTDPNDGPATEAIKQGAQDYVDRGDLSGRILVLVLRHAIERKRAEDALRNSEERYQSLFDAMIDAFSLSELIPDGDSLSVDAHSVAADPAFEQIGGLQGDQAVSERLHGVLPQLVEALRRRAEQLTALQNTVLDITARHDLPTLLQTIVERAALLLNAPSGGLYLCDTDLREVRCVVSYNTARDYSGTVLRYGEGAAGTVAATGKPLVIDDYRVWSSRAAIYDEERPFSALLSAPMIWKGEVTGVIHVLHDAETRRFTRADLELLTVFANHAAIAVATARLLADAQRELDERRQAEAARERMQAQLLQSQKMEAIGTLAGGVAHDFNNLLTAILGYSALAKGGIDPNDPVRKDLDEIQKAATRAASLTRQLLIFSRAQAMEFDALNLNQTVDGVSKMLRRLIAEDIAIEMDLTPGLWTVTGDAGQLDQVIVNLAVNARDAMSNGGTLTIRTDNVCFLEEDMAHLAPAARPGRFVRLSMCDTGTGMDEQTLRHMFEPFYTTKGVGKGTGLGLSVVYGIVSQHDGWIDVHSTPEHGTTFEIYLPAGSARRETDEMQTPASDSLYGRGEQILLVEDHAEVRQFAAKVLSLAGYVVFEAGSASAALDLFDKEKGQFDLIFSDVVLPDFDGIQLLDELRSRAPGCRVLLASGYADDKSQRSLIREKGYRFIDKPYSITDLLRAVQEVIGQVSPN